MAKYESRNGEDNMMKTVCTKTEHSEDGWMDGCKEKERRVERQGDGWDGTRERAINKDIGNKQEGKRDNN